MARKRTSSTSSSNNTRIGNNTYVSLGLVVTVVAMLLGFAVTWGKMQAQVQGQLSRAEAAQCYVTKEELAQLKADLTDRLNRLNDKLDALLTYELKRSMRSAD